MSDASEAPRRRLGVVLGGSQGRENAACVFELKQDALHSLTSLGWRLGGSHRIALDMGQRMEQRGAD